MIPRVRRIIRLLPVLVFSLGKLFAAEAAAVTGPTTETDPMKLEGIFNTDLPRTERKSNVRFIFHPHFGDLTNRDYLRMPLGLRWGATERLELSTEVETYLAHGLRHASFGSGAGLSGVAGGFKYRWADWLKPYWDTASGVNFAQPVGSPPPDVTDGLRHVTPYVTFAHELEAREGMTFFVGLAQDFVSTTSVRGKRQKNDFVDDTWTVTPGFVWHRGAFHYTLELSCQSSALETTHGESVFSVRPAVSWDLPRSLTFNSKGRWVFGLGLRASHGPDGNDFGVSGKFRGEFNLKRMFGLASRSATATR